MALTADGKIFTWGRNNYGQLGITGVQQTKENKPHEMMYFYMSIIKKIEFQKM